ncbi:MAG: Peptidase U32 [Desulfonauticus sp. 38_4375]|jgi:putative protease|nr:MAG: Peptidase U32 [Desulfonauticus sp. 38_4375]
MFRPELLCPAGDEEKFFTALTYGADALYLGGEELSLRAKTKGFSLQNLSSFIQIAHNQQVKVYFCLNILAQEKHLPQVQAYLEQLKATEVDGLIIADPGVISLAQKIAPHIPIHLSTQANTSNSASILFWQSQGVKRVNLARELDHRQIAQIKAQVGERVELEVFVHGAMCMAISGRCFLSSYLNQRSANLGLCTHPCRFEYKLIEKTREQELFEVQEEEFSKILASEDLGLIKYLNWFKKKKIHSLKIEGRNKTTSYLARTVDAYKTALLDLEKKQFSLPRYYSYLEPSLTRPLSTGFFLSQRKILLHPLAQKKAILGQVAESIDSNTYTLKVKSRWDTTKKVNLLLPRLKKITLEPKDYALEKENGERVSLAHPGLTYVFKTDSPYLAPHLLLEEV